MSFHPLMAYDERFHKSERDVVEEGEPFTFTPERRAKLDEIISKYPPERRRSAVLAALYLVQEQVGYLTGNGMRHVAGILDLTPAEVEDVASYYRVEARRRLVEDQELRPVSHGGDEARLRAHALGEFLDLLGGIEREGVE